MNRMESTTPAKKARTTEAVVQPLSSAPVENSSDVVAPVSASVPPLVAHVMPAAAPPPVLNNSQPKHPQVIVTPSQTAIAVSTAVMAVAATHPAQPQLIQPQLIQPHLWPQQLQAHAQQLLQAGPLMSKPSLPLSTIGLSGPGPTFSSEAGKRQVQNSPRVEVFEVDSKSCNLIGSMAGC